MITFISSHGTLVVNESDGSINLEESDLSDWLLDIKKVDIEEFDNYNKLNGNGLCSDGDVLDFGYWDKDDNYHIADMDWRMETFHNVNLTESEIKNNISNSIDWIKKNR